LKEIFLITKSLIPDLQKNDKEIQDKLNFNDNLILKMYQNKDTPKELLLEKLLVNKN
jgi:hypothetical protein